MRLILQLCLLVLMLLGAEKRAWSKVAASPPAAVHGWGQDTRLGGGRDRDAPPRQLTSGEAAAWDADIASAGDIHRDDTLTMASPVVVTFRGRAFLMCPGAPPPFIGSFRTTTPAWVAVGPNVYAYVKQNPWTGWDPHGLQLRVRTDPTPKGGTHTHMILTGKVVDSSKTTRSAKEQEKIVKRMIKAIEKSFKGKDGNHSWDIEVHLENTEGKKEFTNRSKVGKDDHVFEIVDGLARVTKHLDGTQTVSGIGYTPGPKNGLTHGGKLMKIDNRLLTEFAPPFENQFAFDRTVPHELGHSAGLFHPKDRGPESDRNPLFNLIKGGNLMHQSSDDNISTHLNSQQVKVIQNLHDAKKINLD